MAENNRRSSRFRSMYDFDASFLDEIYGYTHNKTYTKDPIRFIEHWKPLAKPLDFSIDPTKNLVAKNHLWKRSLPNTSCNVYRDIRGIIVEQGGMQEFIELSRLVECNIDVMNWDTLYKQLVDNALICYPTYEF